MANMDLDEHLGFQIDSLINLDLRTPAGYGKASIRGKMRPLYEAAKKYVGGSPTFKAAQRLVHDSNRGDVMFMTTGFIVPFYCPQGEHDGNVGSSLLARSLAHGLGVNVVLFTEEEIVPVLEVGCRAAGVRVLSLEDMHRIPGSVSIVPFPKIKVDAEKRAKEMIEKYTPKAVIAVEKGGWNEKGLYHTARGNDISELTAEADYLFYEAKEAGIPTISIIDLGNEIGSGSILQAVHDVIPFGAKCLCDCGGGTASTTPVDYPIVCTCCNWGAYGLVAALAGLLEDERIFVTPELEKRVLRACIDAGSTDGVSVDGLVGTSGISSDHYAHLINLLRVIAEINKLRYHSLKTRK